MPFLRYMSLCAEKFWTITSTSCEISGFGIIVRMDVRTYTFQCWTYQDLQTQKEVLMMIPWPQSCRARVGCSSAAKTSSTSPTREHISGERSCGRSTMASQESLIPSSLQWLRWEIILLFIPDIAGTVQGGGFEFCLLPYKYPNDRYQAHTGYQEEATKSDTATWLQLPLVGFGRAKCIAVWKKLSYGYLGRGAQVGRRLTLSMVAEWSLRLLVRWIVKLMNCVLMKGDQGVYKEG